MTIPAIRTDIFCRALLLHVADRWRETVHRCDHDINLHVLIGGAIWHCPDCEDDHTLVIPWGVE